MKGAFSKRRYLIFLLYICFIYGNSLTPASVSSKESGFVLTKIQEIFSMAGWETLWLTEHLIRKGAHFAEYALLGFLGFWTFQTGGERTRRALALFFLWLVPFVDETIHLFVPGRSGQISDVWLDMAGGSAGFLAVFLLEQYKMRKRK